MKVHSFLLSSLLVASFMTNANAVTLEKSLANGMDAAILDAFNEAVSSKAIDDTSKITLDQIKSSISALKIDGQNLQVSFDDNKVKSILQNLGVASWDGFNEPVLVWIAQVSDSQTTVLSGDSEGDFASALSGAATKNNYNLLFPVMDLDDVQSVSADTILSHSDSILAKASKRYDAKYFVAGALEQQGSDDNYIVKWNAYDIEGKSLGNGQSQGQMSDVATNMSRDIAKIIMQNNTQSNNDVNTQNTTVDSIPQETVDGSIALGPVNGGVRVQITGIDNVLDYQKIRRALITYGYEADINVLGYTESGVIFMIPTGASATILDGTLAHAQEFTKVGDWTYMFKNSNGQVKAHDGVGTVSRSSESRVTSDMKNYGDKAYTKKSVKTTTEVEVKKVENNDVPVLDFSDDDSSGIVITN